MCLCGCVKQSSISWARGDQVEKVCALSVSHLFTLTERTNPQKNLLREQNKTKQNKDWSKEANLQGFHLHGPMRRI